MLALRLFQIFVITLLAYSILFGFPKRWQEWAFLASGYIMIASLIIGVENYG